ncbi:MAG: M48 family metalloprotease [Burkholderiales bacterium]|nr:M48 family metalloprotease [Burkholderiales bacterium]
MNPPKAGERIHRGEMTRRDFLWLVSAAGSAAAVPALSGCAAHPVTGRQMLVGLSEEQELGLDRQRSPHQISRDFGATRDPGLNRYAAEVGSSLSSRSHRPAVPYSFRVVNANYINAYAFPGGTIAATRGILLEMQSEAEFAALMGHEIGHVNARHSAQSAGQGLLAQIAVAGVAIAAGASERSAAYAPLIQIAGTVGASALLASYSRENEREADGLGMEYMTRAGYSPDGMVGLMGVLVRQSRHKPGMLDTMFSSHPVSSERLASMQADAAGRYAGFRAGGLGRERYMDRTAGLRSLKPAIEEQQKGERLMARKSLGEAEAHFAAALQAAPDDYTGLCLMARCQVAQRRYERARVYAAQARQIYPGEPQAMQLSGVARMALKDYPAAYQEFDAYERALPGDANAAFLKGVSLEAMQNRPAAAREYQRYLRVVQSGSQARHAATRLRDWGYAK